MNFVTERQGLKGGITAVVVHLRENIPGEV